MSQIWSVGHTPWRPKESEATNTNRALNEWMTISALLASTIQKYHESCSALALICARSLPGLVEKQFFNNALAAVSAELLATHSQDETVAAARKHLASIKNRSAPISKLPSEILGYIFELSKSPCMHEAGSTTQASLHCSDAISGVCSYWRHVSLSIPSLWDHIGISSGSPFYGHRERATVLLERSCEKPLHVHLYEPSTTNENYRMEHNSEISRVSNFLTPHMSRIRFLSVESDGGDGYHSILSSWLDNIAPGTTTGLSYCQPGDTVTLDLDRFSEKPHAEHLLSLRVLRLQNALFPFNSLAYHGLVDLQLDFSNRKCNVPISSFAAILASSPGLMILKLENVRLVSMADWDYTITYALQSLEVLNLGGMGLHSQRLLLSLISPSRRNVNLSVGLVIGRLPTLYGGLESFFKRSHITTLYARPRVSEDHPDYVMKILDWVPNLEYLILDGYQIRDNEPLNISTPDELRHHAQDAGTTQSYHLPVLILHSCIIELDDLTSLVHVSGVQTLRLDVCDTPGPGDASDGQEYEIDDIGESIRQTYPEIECIVSDKDTTWGWPCRTIAAGWWNCF
ncbi:hypothetical protein BDV93DRAFT_258842 [Ceratobasidium sp. AG-I]|nr:hypothetical protein BDV93DRAFT_258842 [Ceratobasidium sp. AG-I]